MVTNHKNLEYFTSSKKLSHHQARWAEFLGQFNMKVRFRPGRLGSKPDALTHRWDIYTEGDNLEPAVTNICPVFTIEQLAGTLVLAHAGTMEDPTPSNNLDHDAVDGVGTLNCATNPNYPNTEPRMRRIKTRTGPSVSGSTVAKTHFSNQNKQMNPLFQKLNRP